MLFNVGKHKRRNRQIYRKNFFSTLAAIEAPIDRALVNFFNVTNGSSLQLIIILGKKEIRSRVKNHVWEILKWGLSSNGENVVLM